MEKNSYRWFALTKCIPGEFKKIRFAPHRKADTTKGSFRATAAFGCQVSVCSEPKKSTSPKKWKTFNWLKAHTVCTVVVHIHLHIYISHNFKTTCWFQGCGGQRAVMHCVPTATSFPMTCTTTWKPPGGFQTCGCSAYTYKPFSCAFFLFLVFILQ